jgi:hypothetical protein
MEVKMIDYDEQQEHNKRLFFTLMKEVRPDLEILADLLDKTNINLMVVFHIIKALLKIKEGSGYGNINIEVIDNKVGFIRGEEKTLVNEDIQKMIV